MRTPLIQVNNFSFQYPGATKPSLNHINLAVHPGEMVLLTGRSGSGKSTLCLALKGFIPHNIRGEIEGQITVGGLDTQTSSVAELALKIGMVMQDPEVQLCNLQVQDEVLFGPENLQFSVERCWANLENALKQTGLAGLEKRSIHHLSGGEKQRLAIASVLAMEPMAIVLDEPTANLSPRYRQEIRDLLIQMRQDRRTMIVIQHELDDLIEVVDRIILMDRGTILDDDAPHSVINRWGKRLFEECGVGLPQVSEIASYWKHVFTPLPLTPGEFTEATKRQSLTIQEKREDVGEQPEVIPALTEPLVEVEHVSFSYNRKHPAVQDVSFEVRRGEVVAIIGENGSGKSTLAKLMVGLRQPDQGEMKLHGKPTSKYSRHELSTICGYVFQYPEHQFLAQSVRAEVAYGLSIRGVEASEIEQRVTETLAKLNLQGYEERHPFSLSGGEKRRLSVATMLILEPDLLILDEPSYAQDAGNMRDLVEQIFQLAAGKNGTIIFITHDLALVASYATRVIVMDRSQLVFDGSPRQLFQDPDLLNRSGLSTTPVMDLIQCLNASGLHLPTEWVTVADFIRHAEVRAM